MLYLNLQIWDNFIKIYIKDNCNNNELNGGDDELFIFIIILTGKEKTWIGFHFLYCLHLKEKNIWPHRRFNKQDFNTDIIYVYLYCLSYLTDDSDINNPYTSNNNRYHLEHSSKLKSTFLIPPVKRLTL